VSVRRMITFTFFNSTTQHPPNLRHHEPSAPSQFYHLKVRSVGRCPGTFSDPKPDLAETNSTAATLNVVKRPAGSLRRSSLASRPSVPGLQPVTAASKPPMRILVPPTKRPSITTATQRSGVVRPPTRKPSTTGSLPKPVVVTTKTIGKSTDGPRRILVQASDKPAPRTASMPTMSAPKIQGPQRVLVRTASGTTNPVKKPLGLSTSINPPAPPSRLPGPSRIAIPSTSKPKTGTSGGSKPAGRWV